MLPVYQNDDKKSFAYVSLHKRWPVLIGQAVNDIRIETSQLPDGPKKDEAESIITQMEAVQNSVAQNLPIEPITADVYDKDEYNKFVFKPNSTETYKWSERGWLDCECLIYRKLQIVVESSKHWRGYDYFARMKNDTFVKSSSAVSTLANRYHKIYNEFKSKESEVSPEALKIVTHELLQTCLWGNATDLSLLVTVSMEELRALQVSAAAREKESVLDNDFEDVWKQLNSEKGGRVDIILDNSGFELYTDLVFTLFLLDSGLAEQVVLHPKTLPWMISDVLPTDLPTIIGMLTDPSSFPDSREDLDFIAGKLHQYLNDGQLLLRTSPFWVTSVPYWEIKPNGILGGDAIYRDLRCSKLAIFKGDLNYRKLTGDCVWPYDTPFRTAIKDLANTGIPVLALRTVKADVIVGLEPGRGEQLDKEWKENHPDDEPHAWAWGGKYAVVSFNK